MYFCRHCGLQYLTDNAVVCVRCGAPKGAGTNFCPNCCAPTPPNGVVCLKCGIALANYGTYSDKSKIAAGLFGIFFGAFGVHNFYLGYQAKAIIQLVCSIVSILLLCLGGFSAFILIGIHIWGLIEGIMILSGGINKDGKGKLLVK